MPMRTEDLLDRVQAARLAVLWARLLGHDLSWSEMGRDQQAAWIAVVQATKNVTRECECR